MRKLILKMSVSVDGFVGSLDGHNEWMFGHDPAAKNWSAEAVSRAGLHVMGSRTFRLMASHWPTATGPFAPAMNRIPKVVFSRRGAAVLERLGAPPPGVVATLQAGAESWAAAEVAAGDLATEVARLKAQAGSPIMAHGGAALARSLVAHRLVDEYVLLVLPVALGRGLPLFSDIEAPRALALVGSMAFPGGAVAQTYRPA